MEMLKDKKLWIFTFSTLIFCVISFLTRYILVAHCNNFNFKIFTIEYIKNYGAAFSLFHTHTSMLINVSMIILFLALFYIYKNISKFTKTDVFFSSMLCAGIICNLLERLMDGYVTDYFRLNFVMFPIFNISDVFICIGAFILVCNILFNDDPAEATENQNND